MKYWNRNTMKSIYIKIDDNELIDVVVKQTIK